MIFCGKELKPIINKMSGAKIDGLDILEGEQYISFDITFLCNTIKPFESLSHTHMNLWEDFGN